MKNMIIRMYSKKRPKKTPKNKILDMENKFGESYRNLAEKYDETYATIYGRIYRRRKKKQFVTIRTNLQGDENMKIEKVKLSDLNSPSWNPRYITDEDFKKLKNSIETFGYVDPIIVNKHNMNIVGGNQRYQALKKLGYKEIDVVFINEPNLDKEKALNISLNKISGEWDTIKLNKLFEEVELSEVDVSLTGFDDFEIMEMSLLNEFNQINFDDLNENDLAKDADKQDKVYEIIIKCLDDNDQNNIYNKLKKMGYNCSKK